MGFWLVISILEPSAGSYNAPKRALMLDSVCVLLAQKTVHLIVAKGKYGASFQRVGATLKNQSKAYAGSALDLECGKV